MRPSVEGRSSGWAGQPVLRPDAWRTERTVALEPGTALRRTRRTRRRSPWGRSWTRAISRPESRSPPTGGWHHGGLVGDDARPHRRVPRSGELGCCRSLLAMVGQNANRSLAMPSSTRPSSTGSTRPPSPGGVLVCASSGRLELRVPDGVGPIRLRGFPTPLARALYPLWALLGSLWVTQVTAWRGRAGDRRDGTRSRS